MPKAQIIDGKALAFEITSRLKNTISSLRERPPGLATVLVGDDKASTLYVTNKRKTAQEIGIKSFHHHLSGSVSQDDLLNLIQQLNQDQNIDAILVQLPLPKHLDERLVIEMVDPRKDVDGFHPLNLGLLMSGYPRTVACTPLGIMHILNSVGYNLQGKHAVVIGRSIIVGKPVAHLLLQADATVTICHSKTIDLSRVTKEADVLIAAVGKPNMINRRHIKPNAFVIDVGINRDEQNRLCGDVDFLDVIDIASYLTPVPGGVGPLTIAMLLKNTYDNYVRMMT